MCYNESINLGRTLNGPLSEGNCIMTTRSANIRNIQLAQCRPTRRQTNNNHSKFEANRANRAQRRHETEQARLRRNRTIIATAVIVLLIAMSGWITEKFIWIMAMCFSFC